MNKLSEKLYEYIDKEKQPVALSKIFAEKQFSSEDKDDISKTLRSMGSNNLVFRSIKDGKAYYSTDESKGEAINPTKNFIASTAAKLGGIVNSDNSSNDIVFGSPERLKNKKTFDLIDDVTSAIVGSYKPEYKGHKSFTYKENKKYTGNHYSMEFPDQFTVLSNKDSELDDNRDFIAYLPNPEDKDDYIQGSIIIYAGTETPFVSINSKDLKIYSEESYYELYVAEQSYTLKEMVEQTGLYKDAYEQKIGNGKGMTFYTESGCYFFYANIPAYDHTKMIRIDVNQEVAKNSIEAKKIVNELLSHVFVEPKINTFVRLDSDEFISKPLDKEAVKKWNKNLKILDDDAALVFNMATGYISNMLAIQLVTNNIPNDEKSMIRYCKEIGKEKADLFAAKHMGLNTQFINFLTKADFSKLSEADADDIYDKILEFIKAVKKATIRFDEKGINKVETVVKNNEEAREALKNSNLCKEMEKRKNKKREKERLEEERKENAERIMSKIDDDLSLEEYESIVKELEEYKNLKDVKKAISKCEDYIDEIKEEQEKQNALANFWNDKQEEKAELNKLVASSTLYCKYLDYQENSKSLTTNKLVENLNHKISEISKKAESAPRAKRKLYKKLVDDLTVKLTSYNKTIDEVRDDYRSAYKKINDIKNDVSEIFENPLENYEKIESKDYLLELANKYAETNDPVKLRSAAELYRFIGNKELANNCDIKAFNTVDESEQKLINECEENIAKLSDSKKTKKTIIILVLAILLVAGVFYFLSVGRHSEEMKQEVLKETVEIHTDYSSEKMSYDVNFYSSDNKTIDYIDIALDIKTSLIDESGLKIATDLSKVMDGFNLDYTVTDDRYNIKALIQRDKINDKLIETAVSLDVVSNSEKDLLYAVANGDLNEVKASLKENGYKISD